MKCGGSNGGIELTAERLNNLTPRLAVLTLPGTPHSMRGYSYWALRALSTYKNTLALQLVIAKRCNPNLMPYEENPRRD